MKRILFAIIFLASFAAHAQAPPNACTAGNLNAAWADNINNVQYLCTAVGWKPNVGIGAPIVQCSAKNYGNDYTDVSGSVAYKCTEGGWTQIGGGGGGGLPTAPNAGAIPVSTGPGTTYAATPGNTTQNLEVLTSTPAPASGPVTNSCAFVNGGTVTSVGCTWNIAPQAGQTIACTVFGATGNTIGLNDSAGNGYSHFTGHTNSAISTFMQTFYTTVPITGPVTTETATLSVSSFQPGILCNASYGITGTDVQAVADATTAPVSVNLTTTANGDYGFCTGVGGGGSGFSNGSPFTLGAQYSPYFNSINEYYVQPTAGAVTASITGSVTTSASLMCSFFKVGGGPGTPTTAFTSGAPFITNNAIIINVKESGAVGDGGLHPACSYLGLSTLSQLQAYNGGQYSFATSCTNQMDWLGTQYAVNKIAGSGTVKMSGGVYIWDQPVILPNNNDSSSGSNPGLYVVGDGEGGTIIEPAVADFGAGSGMISCQSPTAAPTDNGNTGSGRYDGACYGGLVDLSFKNPYYNGTVNISSSAYARGIINVPGPSASGTAIQMDGIIVGSRMYMHRVSATGFRMGANVVGDHMTWDQVTFIGNFCGMYWAPESIYNQGDLVMQGHNFVNGNSLGGFCVDKTAQFNLYQSGELYVGYQPYGWIKFPGVSDTYAGGGYLPFFTEGNYDQIQAESIGNAVIWDDNLTNSSGGVTYVSGAGDIILPQFKSLFTFWSTGNEITTGGRAQYAWIGANEIQGLTIKNPFSNSGSFLQGGAGQLAGIIDESGGNIEITGDFVGALPAYNTLPFIGNTQGFCNAASLHAPGQFNAEEVFLDSSVTSVAIGKALMVLSDGNIGINDGSHPVIGVAGQSFTNSGSGQCLVAITSGNLVAPFNMTSASSVANGNLLVSAASGQVAAATSSGGYLVGTVILGGTTPWVTLNGMGGFIPVGSTVAVNAGTTGYFGYYSGPSAVSYNPHMDDGTRTANALNYSNTGGIYASAGPVTAQGNLVTQGDVVQFGSNIVQYGGYGNGILAVLNGSSTELTRLNFGTNTNGSVALCPSGTTLTVCGGDGSAVGSLVSPSLQAKVYTVSTLPSASSLPAGTQVVVSDAATFTPGTCTGSGSDYMIAVTNGSAWSCH